MLQKLRCKVSFIKNKKDA